MLAADSSQICHIMALPALALRCGMASVRG
jgi:hypothetical protein